MVLDDGVEITEMQYQGLKWGKPRRMILVRQKIGNRSKAACKMLKLFDDNEYFRQYRYSAYVTNLTLPAAEVWRL